MPTHMVIDLGDQLASALVMTDGQVSASKRWWLGRDPSLKGLGEWAREFPLDRSSQVLLSSHQVRSVLKRRLGQVSALLVTSGFSDWLIMNRPPQPKHFSLRADRAPSFIEKDLVFEVSERIDAEGRIVKALETSDLEILAAKLQLHGVKNVALGFLHSTKNPQHEQLAARELRERGFKVFLSSEASQHPYETARWWAAALSAYLEGSLETALQNIRLALNPEGKPEAQVLLATPQGPQPELVPQNLGGASFAHLTALDRYRQLRGWQSLLYLGWEDFVIFDGRWTQREVWNAEFGTVGVTHAGHTRCSLQPTQALLPSYWGGADFSHEESGYEPGPMAWGKGLTPQLLDVLWLNGRLNGLQLFAEREVERMKSRVTESLLAMERTALRSGHVNAERILQRLESIAGAQILSELPSQTSTVIVVGPLAEALRPALQSHAKAAELQLQFLDESDVLERALAAQLGWDEEAAR